MALYQRKIKEHCKEIAYAPICYKWNIKDIRLVSGRFGSPQEFESAVNSAPYATLIDKCECSFVEADKTILKNNRELRSSEERCLYACLHELKQNELNGSTIMSTAELSHIIFDKYNACYDKLVDREEFDLQDILSEKIDKEFAKYCNSLKEKTQQEIIDSAYEIVSKEAIKEYLKYCDLADKEIAIMIDQNDLLNEFYHDWLDTDDDFYESMEYSINDSIAAVTRYYNKQQKLRIERDDK